MKLAQNKEMLPVSKQTLNQKRKHLVLLNTVVLYFTFLRLQTIHTPQSQCFLLR